MKIEMSINWKLLREQKSWLLKQGASEAEGLISLLDHIQDTAVSQGVPEKEVFGANRSKVAGG